MSDPTINSNRRPLLLEEIKNQGQLKLNEYFFNMGISIEHIGESIEIPESIGRFTTAVYDLSI